MCIWSWRVVVIHLRIKCLVKKMPVLFIRELCNVSFLPIDSTKKVKEVSIGCLPKILDKTKLDSIVIEGLKLSH